MSLALVSRKAALLAPWNKSELWRRARAVPSLDLRFADNKSLTDAVTGASLVTFTRASSGTYVDSQGVIRTATTNLLLNSESYGLNTLSDVTVTANDTIAPDGAATADRLVETATTASHFTQSTHISVSGTIYTYSVYLKNDNRNFAFATVNGTGTLHGISVNLTTGAVASAVGTPSNITTTTLANGWFRVAFTYTSGTSGSVAAEVRLSTNGVWANRSYAGNVSFSLFAWGAQLEQSSTVGEYIPTTNVINSAPRFDHSPATGESLGLLVEEQRTNLHLQSENLSGYVFTASGTGDVLTNSYGTGANGVANKTLRVQTGATPRVLRWVSADGGIDAISTQYCISFFYRGVLPLSVSARGGVSIAPVAIFPPTGTLMGRAYAAITSGANGAAFIDMTISFNTDCELWGFQVEKNASFPTSYIPTTTAAVTRSADVASITGTNFSSFYRADEGTFLVSGRQPLASSNSLALLGLGSGSGSIYQGQGSGACRWWSGSTLLVTTNSATWSSGVKIAASYTSSNRFLCLNAGIVASNATTLANGELICIGTRFDAAQDYSNGTISRLAYWPQRLADSTLQAITQ